MAERKISEKSLENLKRSNQESNAITRESLEISLLQLLDKKDLKKIREQEFLAQLFTEIMSQKKNCSNPSSNQLFLRLLSLWKAIILRPICTRFGSISLKRPRRKPALSAWPSIIILRNCLPRLFMSFWKRGVKVRNPHKDRLVI